METKFIEKLIDRITDIDAYQEDLFAVKIRDISVAKKLLKRGIIVLQNKYTGDTYVKWRDFYCDRCCESFVPKSVSVVNGTFKYPEIDGEVVIEGDGNIKLEYRHIHSSYENHENHDVNNSNDELSESDENSRFTLH